MSLHDTNPSSSRRITRGWLVAVLVLCGAVDLTRAVSAQTVGPPDLRKLSLEELGNIVVTSVTKEPEQVWRTPAAIHVLTAEDIRRSGATSIPEVLRLTPGVQVSRIDGSDWAVAVRGLADQFSQSLLVLVDGRNVYTPLFAGVYWGVLDMPLEDIERIEIIRGPGGTIWGTNAVNGVINIITRTAGQTQGVLASVAGGTFDRAIGTLRFGDAVGSFSYRIYARGAARDAAHHPGFGDFDDWHLAQSGFRADWRLSGRDVLRFDGRIYTGQEGRLVEIGVFEPPSQELVEDSEDVAGGHLSAQYRRQIAPGSDLQFHAYYDRTTRQGVQYGERRHTLEVDLLQTQSLESHTLRFGLGARWSPGTFVQTIPTLEFSTADQTERVLSVFGQDEVSMAADRVRLVLGAKFERNRYTGWEVQPSGRIIWRPGEQQALWGAVSRAIRIPSRLDRDLRLTGNLAANPPTFVRIAGSADFDTEKLVAWEAGYRRLVGRRIYVDTAAFINRHDDLRGFGSPTAFAESIPPPDRTVIQYQFTNAVRGDSRGVEVSPTWIPAAWLELTGAYSFLDLSLENKPGFADPINLATARNRSRSSPRHQGFLQSTFRFPRGLHLTQTFRAVSALDGQNVPAYQTLDLVGSWRMTSDVELSVVGQNLVDANHPEFGGTPGLVGVPRSVYAKVIWRP